VLAGCAARAPEKLPRAESSATALLYAVPVAGADTAPAADVLALDDEMRAFLGTHVDMAASPGQRLRQLLEAVMASGRIDIRYDHLTLTAAETFRRRVGNCLSYTNLFVALARSAGIEARFQEVDVPPDWTQEGGAMVLNRHVDALIDSGDGRDRVVDFNVADFRTSYDHRPISDERAFAHFHSNLGVERMQAGDTGGALGHFRRALRHDAGFAPAWVNLGTLYLRAGHPDQAEAAWRHALRVDPQESVALSNLERLYRQRDQHEAAEELRTRIERHRAQNPYYRYFLARQAFDAADYDTAIAHLRFAIGRKQNEDRFYALLGMSYLRRGDPQAAQRWMARAAEVAADEELQRRYQDKLERLRGSGAG
jgi:Flp pilus assembly protein TadD